MYFLFTHKVSSKRYNEKEERSRRDIPNTYTYLVSLTSLYERQHKDLLTYLRTSRALLACNKTTGSLTLDIMELMKSHPFPISYGYNPKPVSMDMFRWPSAFLFVSCLAKCRAQRQDRVDLLCSSALLLPSILLCYPARMQASKRTYRCWCCCPDLTFSAPLVLVARIVRVNIGNPDSSPVACAKERKSLAR